MRTGFPKALKKPNGKFEQEYIARLTDAVLSFAFGVVFVLPRGLLELLSQIVNWYQYVVNADRPLASIFTV